MKIKELFHSFLIEPNEVRQLIKYHLQKDDMWIMLHEDTILDNLKSFLNLVARAESKEPIEYITQKVSFYSEEFYINSGVLIPRPETELLVDKVVTLAQKLNKNLSIAEIGVGSGIISIMLSKLLNDVRLSATDINPKAIELTDKNIAKHNITNLKTFHCSLLDDIDYHIDILVSNPPYIANDYILDTNVLYEPNEALFGGEIGDEILKQIIDLAYQREIQYIVCEMGYDQKEKIITYLIDKKYKSLEFYTDYSKLDRGFVLIL